MKRGMPSGAQTPDGIIFLLALIFSKAPPRYPPHHGAHWAYTGIGVYSGTGRLIGIHLAGTGTIELLGAALHKNHVSMMSHPCFLELLHVVEDIIDTNF